MYGEWRLARTVIFTAAVALPFYWWWFGPVVSSDQWVVRGLLAGAVYGAVAWYAWVRRSSSGSGPDNDIVEGERDADAQASTAMRLGRRFAIGVAVLHVLLVVWIAWAHSPTAHETRYLVAGLSHWETGHFDVARVNPPLVRLWQALFPLLAGAKTDWSVYPADEPTAGLGGYRPDLVMTARWIRLNGEASHWYVFLGRCANIPLSLLGAWVCWRWALELFGLRAACCAVTLWCLCPFMLTYAALTSPDLGGAALGIAAAYVCWRWARVPNWSRALAFGGALGAAIAARTTNIALLPACVACVFTSSRPRRRRALELAAAMGVALLVLNATYGFEGTFRPLGSYQFISRFFAGHNFSRPVVGNRFRDLIGWLPVPLPEDFVKGVDLQKADFEGVSHWPWSYMAGVWREQAWWYFYLYALAVKLPAGSLILLAAAVIGFLVRKTARSDVIAEVLLACAIAAFFLLVSSQAGFSRESRYIVGVIPFLYVWGSRLAINPLRRSKEPVLWPVLVTVTAVSVLTVYPHCYSYFNAFVGGPFGGPRCLWGGNIDSGQDAVYLSRWAKAHPEARPLFVVVQGQTVYPIHLSGLRDWQPIPADPRSPEPHPKYPPRPGWYAISVSELYYPSDAYAYLRQLKPVAYAGYSIYIFHLTERDVEALRPLFAMIESQSEPDEPPGSDSASDTGDSPSDTSRD